MTTLKMTRGKYRMVLIAMCGLMASSLGVVVNTAGIFFGPIARTWALASASRPSAWA